MAYNVERILRIKRKVVLYIMERRNAWLSYEEADEKELEKLAKIIVHFWMLVRQSVNVSWSLPEKQKQQDMFH